MENIYLTGIENRNGKGVCVVRTLKNYLHNYIQRESIVVTAENIVGIFQVNPSGIPNLSEFENEIRNILIPENLT